MSESDTESVNDVNVNELLCLLASTELDSCVTVTATATATATVTVTKTVKNAEESDDDDEDDEESLLEQTINR
jgi:ribosomal protein L12E/L44/L45/RPP1/RPP2